MFPLEILCLTLPKSKISFLKYEWAVDRVKEPLAMKITVKQFVKSVCFLYKEIPEVRCKPK